MELTKEFVLEKLEEAVDAGIIDELYYISDMSKKQSVELEKFTGFKVETVHEGRSGSDYDICELVYKISSGDQSIFIGIEGYYSSYEGDDWSDGEWNEVEEVEKVIKVYQKK
jgi:hypothetical protein